MLTLEQAIEHCHEKAAELKQQYEYYDHWDDEENIRAEECLDCAKKHEQLADWLTELQERRDADRWVSINDKLPDKEGKCLVFTDYGDVTMDSFVDGMFVCNLGNVTHWRPLPKAPESEVKNDN